jgi:hypothetical protein
MEKIKRKGIYLLVGRLGFEKKSKQDLVKLVAEEKLVAEQLIEIQNAMKKGLTEEQLVTLINNGVSAEQMREIIEIAVLENNME